MINKEVAVRVGNIRKHFRLPTEHASDMKQAFVNWTKGIKGYKKYQVLKDVSFEIEKGDFFGIVGRNGSGKSTLLKLIAGIYEPDSGRIEVNGVMASFIELGVGFNGELTGRENVYLNGALFGFSVAEIDGMYDEIVEFAELGKFMDQKLKNYSSGMQVRLAFACAIRSKADILVLDEVLAVGDEAFQRKCNDYFEKIRRDKNQTVILVTHSMDAVKQYCDKAIMIEDGRVVSDGNPMDVANKYILANFKTRDGSIVDRHQLRIRPTSKQLLGSGERISVEISYILDKDEVSSGVFPSVALLVNGVGLVFDTMREREVINHRLGLNKFRYSYPVGQLSDGVEIKVLAELWQKHVARNSDVKLAYMDIEDGVSFRIVNRGRYNGDILRERGCWDDSKK